MPVLAQEPSQFPADLFASESPPECPGRQWWALYTKARQEKCVARQLLRLQIPFYLPLVPKQLAYRGRRVTSQIPLFSAYVFMHGTEEDRVRSLATNRLSRVLPVSDAVQLWHDLRQVHQLIVAGAPLTVESRLLPGQRVRIRSGAFAGLEGSVVSRQRHTRLVLAVNFLQQGVSVEIDDFLLDPLD